MFAQDNLFDSNELLAMRVLPSIYAKYLQKSLWN